MAAIRIIVTDSSVWTFNYTEMTFNRSPRVEGADHPFVKYTGDWREFDVVEETSALGHEEDRIRFTVYGDNLDEMGSGWITSTYKPVDQKVSD